MNRLSIMFAVLLIALSANDATAANPAADEAAIRQAGKEWIARFKAGDIDGLMKLYMADAHVALHGQPMLSGIAAIRAFFAPALAAKPEVEFLLDIEQIKADGDHAFLVSKYWYISNGGGLPAIRDTGRSVLEYQRDSDGKWKILLDLDQATPDAAFPPPATAQ